LDRLFDFRSLPLQLILSFVGVVFLTAAIAGISAIWIIRGQLESQVWSQLYQGSRTALSLYTATQNEVASFATLTAQRPTLHKLLNQGDRSDLVNYLFTLQTGAGQDLLAVCDAENGILAITVDPARDDFCRAWQASGYHLNDKAGSGEIWFSTSRSVSSLNGDSWIVIAGKRLDADFARRMRIETGLEHILRFAGNPIVSSSLIDPSAFTEIAFEPASGGESGEGLRATFSLEDQPYYATLLHLDESNLDVILALSIADIVGTQQRLAWVLAVSSFGVALLGSILGILLARRISSPLTRMADMAHRFSTGELSTPIAINGPVREVAQVSRALERARSEAIATMQPLTEKYGQRLVVELLMSIPMVKADSRRTIQVLINLLSNASKYGPPDAEIKVRANSIDNWVKISVQDRGPGIPSKYRKIIFQRFVYPTTNGASSKVGAGLGLSVVKAVVEAQGGQVGVDDRPGGGSIFWFTLPMVKD
jgi:signal transduction histidine kinase